MLDRGTRGFTKNQDITDLQPFMLTLKMQFIAGHWSAQRAESKFKRCTEKDLLAFNQSLSDSNLDRRRQANKIRRASDYSE